jgi:hypothetical protein
VREREPARGRPADAGEGRTAGPADDGPGAARAESPAGADAYGSVAAEAPAKADAAAGPMAPVWHDVVDRVARQRASLGGILAGLDAPDVEGDELVLRVPGDRRFVADTLREPRNQRLVEDAVASAWTGPRPLRLRVHAGEPAASDRPPLRRLDRNDPLVRRALEVFDADPVV